MAPETLVLEDEFPFGESLLPGAMVNGKEDPTSVASFAQSRPQFESAWRDLSACHQ